MGLVSVHVRAPDDGALAATAARIRAISAVESVTAERPVPGGGGAVLRLRLRHPTTVVGELRGLFGSTAVSVGVDGRLELIPGAASATPPTARHAVPVDTAPVSALPVDLAATAPTGPDPVPAGPARTTQPSGADGAIERLALDALRAVPDAWVVVFDPQRRCLFVGGAGRRPRGLGDRIVFGRTAEDVLPDPVWRAAVPGFDAALAGHELTLAIVVPHDDSAWDVTFAPVVRDGVVVAGLATGRERAGSSPAADTAVATRDRLDVHDAVFAAAPVAQALVAPSGEIALASRRFGALLGLEATPLVGVSLAAVVHPDDRFAEQATRRVALDGTTPSYRMTCQVLRADGRPIAVRLDATVVRDDDGQAIALGVVLTPHG